MWCWNKKTNSLSQQTTATVQYGKNANICNNNNFILQLIGHKNTNLMILEIVRNAVQSVTGQFKCLHSVEWRRRNSFSVSQQTPQQSQEWGGNSKGCRLMEPDFILSLARSLQKILALVLTLTTGTFKSS